MCLAVPCLTQLRPNSFALPSRSSPSGSPWVRSLLSISASLAGPPTLSSSSCGFSDSSSGFRPCSGSAQGFLGWSGHHGRIYSIRSTRFVLIFLLGFFDRVNPCAVVSVVTAGGVEASELRRSRSCLRIRLTPPRPVRHVLTISAPRREPTRMSTNTLHAPTLRTTIARDRPPQRVSPPPNKIGCLTRKLRVRPGPRLFFQQQQKKSSLCL